MSSGTRVKICGLSTPESVAAAVEGGAAYVGFVFFGKSPRNVAIEQARDLAVDVPPGVAKVALVVDADDAALDAGGRADARERGRGPGPDRRAAGGRVFGR